MRVAMIGAGYVGLVSAACIADFGHHVICVDKDIAKIRALELGEIPILRTGPTGSRALERQRSKAIFLNCI